MTQNLWGHQTSPCHPPLTRRTLSLLVRSQAPQPRSSATLKSSTDNWWSNWTSALHLWVKLRHLNSQLGTITTALITSKSRSLSILLSKEAMVEWTWHRLSHRLRPSPPLNNSINSSTTQASTILTMSSSIQDLKKSTLWTASNLWATSARASYQIAVDKSKIRSR